MVDKSYLKEHLSRKKRLKEMYEKVRQTKETQEIYHRIMGSLNLKTEGEEEGSKESTEE